MKSKKTILFLTAAAFFAVVILGGSKGLFDQYLDQPKLGEGKRLIVGVANDTITLDPANSTEMDSVKVTVNIFETLVKYEKEGNSLQPCLAESWEASEDGLNFIFYLRKDVQFHDGSPFDAQSVVFNFSRWMNEKNPYHNGGFSYWNYVFGGFPGFIREVKAISKYIVQIRLKRPYGPFLSALAMPSFGIQSPGAIMRYGSKILNHPVGTGPFVFKRRDIGKHILLTRNNNYWGNVAKVDELEFRIIASSQERLKQLELGNIQLADNLNPDAVDRVQGNQMLQLYLRPSFNTGYLAMNNQKSPFDNRLVRNAISKAIDKDGLIKVTFNNVAKAAKTLIPPTLWGYNESIKESKYDPAEAKKLLAQAGYANGFQTTLWVMNNSRSYLPRPLQTAQFLQKNLKAIGIDAKITAMDWDIYLEKIKNGEHDMALIGWTGDMMDPDNFLYTLLASENAKIGIAGNFCFYKNQDVDLLLSQARQNSNMIFRKSMYRRLLEKIDYDMPAVPLVHTMPVVATLVSVKGYVPGITGLESLEKVDIE